jgi:hypothetical protein
MRETYGEHASLSLNVQHVEAGGFQVRPQPVIVPGGILTMRLLYG